MEPKHVAVQVFSDDGAASAAVAARMAALIRKRAGQGRRTVLGLATGQTPIGVYRELVRLHRSEGLDFSSVVTFNLDEYWPVAPDAFQSYRRWMWENLFQQINVPERQVHVPRGDLPRSRIESWCRSYEKQIALAGGVDFQLLGIGRTGHIGFNEPGSPRESRTRLVALDKVTRADAAGDFFGEENVPRHAVTMGVGTILEAREIAVLAFGEHKAAVVRRAVEEGVSTDVAASYLQAHPNATFYLDQAAAAGLTRIATPWLAGPCDWTEALQTKAVLWLAQRLRKPILRLTDEDYAENGLSELLGRHGGSSYQLNIDVFKRMMATITGWPGGKRRKRRVLIFSPHPDDDVICMGGTMARLVGQGHDVHVAYMVSGALSVFDHDVERYADFVGEFSSIFGLTPRQTRTIEAHIDRFLRRKRPGDVDSSEVLAVKALIRRSEALAAAKYCGVPSHNVHFLNLPFYNTGHVEKSPLTQADVGRVVRLLRQKRPATVFAAGDLSDPHGTHRLCLAALREAVSSLPAARRPEIWLYRGAWQEWAPEQIEMAVPLSPDELLHKRLAIFRHQSQKDRAMFPGPYDRREFWQRAEDRNTGTARTYDLLGLPEYPAIEAFARFDSIFGTVG